MGDKQNPAKEIARFYNEHPSIDGVPVSKDQFFEFLKDPYAGKTPTPNQDAEREREQIAQLQDAQARMRFECLAAGPAPDPKAGGDTWRVSTRPDGTQLSELVAGPSFESRQDDSLDAMASGIRHTKDEIRRSPSLSMFYASRSGPLSGEERVLLHPDAERRRLAQLEKDHDNAAREKFSGAIAYLFGAVTDDPDYKRRFTAAQRYCERWGMTVLNPTRHPVTPAGPLPMEFYMRHGMIDVEACEVMIPVPSPFLEGSAGAAAERAYAVCLGKPILDGFIPEEV